MFIKVKNIDDTSTKRLSVIQANIKDWIFESFWIVTITLIKISTSVKSLLISIKLSGKFKDFEIDKNDIKIRKIKSKGITPNFWYFINKKIIYTVRDWDGW